MTISLSHAVLVLYPSTGHTGVPSSWFSFGENKIPSNQSPLYAHRLWFSWDNYDTLPQFLNWFSMDSGVLLLRGAGKELPLGHIGVGLMPTPTPPL